MYVCKNPDCDFVGIRDLVGATNIKNKHEHGREIVIGAVLPPAQAKYLRVVKTPVARPPVVVALTGRTLLGTAPDPVSSAPAEDAHASLRLDPAV
jgi:putative transposase